MTLSNIYTQVVDTISLCQVHILILLPLDIDSVSSIAFVSRFNQYILQFSLGEICPSV